MKRLIYIILILACSTFISFFLTSIKIMSLEHPWSYDDLRMLDPIDSNLKEQELIALYTRTNGTEYQFRLDFMDLPRISNGNVYLELSYSSNNDSNKTIFPDKTVIKISGFRIIQVVNEVHDINPIKIRVVSDPENDSLVISLQLLDINHPTNALTVKGYVGGGTFLHLADEIGPVRFTASPPPPVEVSFVFWDSFLSNTPAQALRSWDGAHTGINSERSGLVHLLKAAENWNFPVYFTDLHSKENIAALKYMRVWQQVEELEQSGVVGFLQCEGLDYFCGGRLGYGYTHNIPDTFNRNAVIEQILVAGPTIPRTVHFLGGSLVYSAWANSAFAENVFSYITQHPWIKVTRHNPIQYLLRSQVYLPANNLQSLIYSNLVKAHQNPASESAWNMFRLFTQQADPEIKKLGEIYLGQIGHQLQASHWLSNPQSLKDCTQDIDWDGALECILASESVFASIELDGGNIVTLYVILGDSVHQIIAPTWQFSLSLADPTTWNFVDGIRADPSHIAGGLVTENIHAIPFYPSYSDEGLILSTSNVATRIAFQVLPDGLSISKSSPDSLTHLFSFVLDPWLFYSNLPNNNYHTSPVVFKDGIFSWDWQLPRKVTVFIHTNGILSIDSFLDSKELLVFPEDPNREYPMGHYLPFPITRASIYSPKDLQISIWAAP